MAKTIVIDTGHLSLEYDDSEHDYVKAALVSLDNNLKVTLRLDSGKLEVLGNNFVVGSDEMSRFIISTSDSGDDIIRSLDSLLPPESA